MDTTPEFPSFDDHLPDLNQFILELVEAYRAGKVDSWDELETRVKSFFTPERMDETESVAPGWKKMASYSEGITLTHVMCVFLGLFMLPEFRALTPEQQQLAKWIILFHDIDKFHIRGKKDTMHAFNSAVVAANVMPGLGFHITSEYHQLINSWSGFTRQAFIPTGVEASPKPDNQKLPEILSGIDQLFRENTPASLITKTILLHISLDVDKNYPTPAPLTDDEIQRSINTGLLPLLKVMMLSDNEGWSMFDPETRVRQRNETLDEFTRVEGLIRKR
jgi:hypothetical protein